MSTKIIKDSIHGYITLDETFSYIIDSPEFQRLKYIEQGSFRVLYPAARHDRFIHSLGTYHLACKFAQNFIQNIQEDLEINFDKVKNKNKIKCKIEKIQNTFYYAALLHDIGHAPFSHTTEKFFKGKTEIDGSTILINKQLCDAVFSIVEEDKAERFKSEFDDCSPSPHEIMSATILINNADNFLRDKKDNFDLELAARMVIGCTYDYNRQEEIPKEEKIILGIKNCFIRLLNSETVDVDKLDYITRDTQMSGFDNVPIDIERLVRSVTAIRLENKEWIYPAFRKNALSVIDNVFRAKTEQSLWMVSHPIVVYDSELLSYCIHRLNSLLGHDYISDVFSIDALGQKGVTVNEKEYRLLNDIDISADLRTFYEKEELFRELYERQTRRHPIWKSYYEYKYLFKSEKNTNTEEDVFVFFKGLMDYMKDSEIFVLCDESLNQILKDHQVSQEVKDAASFLNDFCVNNKINLNFVLLPSANSFSANFNAESVYILFSKLPERNRKNYETYKFLKDSGSNEDKHRMFYLYSKEKFSKEQMKSFKETLINQINQKKMPRP